MSFVSMLLGNLRSNVFLYIVCVIGMIAVMKYMDRYPRQKKFAILGILLVGGSGLALGFVSAILHAVLIPSMQEAGGKAWQQGIEMYNAVLMVLSFLQGILHAAGFGSVLYALLMDKMVISAKKSKRNSDREDDEDRPRRRGRRADDEDRDDEQPRRRRERDEDD